MTQSGAIANKNGDNLEKAIEDFLKRAGYEFIDKNRFLSFSKVSEQPIYSTQVNIGNTIYDKKKNCDFILFHPKKHLNCLIIECKWQQSGGSVDEKYPYLVLNVKQTGIDTVIILDGGGYSDGAEKWLKQQVSGCLKKVVNLSQFQKDINKGFLG